MKFKYIFLIVAVVLFSGIGISTIKNNAPEKKNISPVTIEVIDDEEFTVDPPFIPSFSNAESNKKVSTTKPQVVTTSLSSSKKTKNPVTPNVNTFVEPLEIGFYYLDTINKQGIDACSLVDESSTSSQSSDLDLGDLEIQNFEVREGSAYLFVKAENIPKKTCAKIVEFKKSTNNIFKSINIIYTK